MLLLGVASAHAQPLPAQSPALLSPAAREAVSSVLRLRARILPNARSIETLGAMREGSAVLVGERLVLTIGYLVIEADAIEVTGANGKAVPATLAGYDHATGFALLRLLAPVEARPLPIGDASTLKEGDAATVATWGLGEAMQAVRVVSRRAFSGSWEYLLESAIFTSPPVPDWSGAALISGSGELLGLGSLIVADAAQPGVRSPGNMFVPVDLLKPGLEELAASGRAGAPRPWLGMSTEEVRGRLFVTRVSPDGPADRAGVEAGDIVLGVGVDRAESLAAFYRQVWALGGAGTEIPIRVLRGTGAQELRLNSIDRNEYLRRRPTY